MSDILKKQDVRNLQIALDDGSVWEGELNDYGRVILKHQIKPPTSTAESEPTEQEAKPEASPEPTEAKEEAKTETSPAEASGEAEEGEGEPAGAFDDVVAEKNSVGEIVDQFGKEEQTDQKPVRNDQTGVEIPKMPAHIKESLEDTVFRSRLSSIMLDNKYDRMLKGRSRGKLDMTRLYKVPTQSKSVFMQKQSRRGKQYNVLLLVDESGSMNSGDKSEKAAEAAVFLAKSFEGININVAIVGFNAFVTTRKEFTGKCDYDNVYEAIRTMNFRQGHGSNNDWDGLNKAYHMLAHAPEGEKILIMLSDGAPASERRYENIDIRGNVEPKFANAKSMSQSHKDSKEHLHHLVKSNKNVASIGIGIMHGGWQIPDHSVIKNVNELKREVVRQLKKHIKRG